MTNSSPKRLPPVSVRFSESERAWLLARAGHKPLSTYIKTVLFADGPVRSRIAASTVKGDREALARLLAWLGQTQIAGHLAVIANAAESGSLDMSEPVTASVLKACADINDMREALMRAIGKKDVGRDDEAASGITYVPPRATKLKISAADIGKLSHVFAETSAVAETTED